MGTTDDAAQDPHEQVLRRRVALMRELGVVRWGDVEITPVAPAPPASFEAAPTTDGERLDAIKTRLREKFETLYAATGRAVGEEEIDRLAQYELRVGAS